MRARFLVSYGVPLMTQHARSLRISFTLLFIGLILPGSVAAQTYVTQWGAPGSGNGEFNQPVSLAIAASGSVYVADTNNHRIQEFTSNGTYLTQWGTFGTGDGQLHDPSGVTIDASGNIYVVDKLNHRIQRFTSDGAYLSQWETSAPGTASSTNLSPLQWL